MIDRCIACLAVDYKCFIINNHFLEFYEKLANIQLSDVGMQKTICYICYSQLQKFYNFMEMSQEAGKILTQIISDAVQVDQETKVPNLKLSYNLVKTMLEPMDISSDIITNSIDDEILATRAKVKQEINEVYAELELFEVKEELMTVEVEPCSNGPKEEANVSEQYVSINEAASQRHINTKSNKDEPKAPISKEEQKQVRKHTLQKQKNIYKWRDDEATTSTSTGSRVPRGKNAQYYRDYRARKRAEREKESLNRTSDPSATADPCTINVAGSVTSKKRKSAAEYQREYRARQKAKRDNILIDSLAVNPSISTGRFTRTHQSTIVDQLTTAGPSTSSDIGFAKPTRRKMLAEYQREYSEGCPLNGQKIYVFEF